MKRLLSTKVIIGILLVGVIAVTAGVLGARAARSQPTDVAWLHDYALKMARDMGEPNPTMEYALTNQADAQPAMRRATVVAQDPTASVYIVILHGDFTDKMAFGPEGTGASPPTGSTLVLEVDAKTQEPIALYLTPVPSRVDTTKIGATSSLSQ
jgi:hypothetical protein